jgi:uncharacterized membrane protein required for colicin V production
MVFTLLPCTAVVRVLTMFVTLLPCTTVVRVLTMFVTLLPCTAVVRVLTMFVTLLPCTATPVVRVLTMFLTGVVSFSRNRQYKINKRFPNKAEFVHTLSKSKEKNVILLQILSI